MEDSRELIQTGVNFDYILALKKVGDRVKVIEVPITRRKNRIDALLSMLDNNTFDKSDMYGIMRSTYPYSKKEYPYCFGHECNDILYGNLVFPEFDSHKYLERLSLDEKRIKQYELKKKFDYANQLRQSLEKRKYTDKLNYLSDALAYIAADDYDRTIQDLIANKDYVAYSNEHHGWYVPIHKITDDISVQIKTNFCFGNSTHSLVIVKYKGIKILPYGEWVSYYFARIDELIGCTRSYALERGCWHQCMEFLEDFINSAIDDPYNFVKSEVMIEVNTLIDGLEDIFNTDSARLEKEMRVQRSKTEERYIGIRGARIASEHEIEIYKISPDEVTMIYRMEKVCCALKFLDSLRELQEIYSEVTSAINKIIELNIAIRPEVDAAIPPVESEVQELMSQLEIKRDKGKYLSERIEKFEERLKRLCKNTASREDEEIISQKFRASNPLFEQYKNEYDDVYQEVRSLSIRHSDRSRLLKRLVKYKDLIETYTTTDK